jgi:two-component system chemotaxis response regulator CheB
VDDAVVVRRLLAGLLAEDPAIEVVGVAANGRIALAKLPLLDPDVVVLDVEMPELDGLATLAEIRRQRPRLPVIMFSSLTERGAAATLEALALGATDYVTKPAAAGGPGAAMRQVRQELATKVKVLSGRQERPAGPPGPARTAPPSWRATRPGPVEVVAVGSSTGGPNALAELLSRLPRGFAVPMVVVQHMPPLFTRLLAERLAARCPLRVAEAVPGAVLEPGQVWIAPGDHHLVVRRAGALVELAVNQEPPENSCRPSVDALFRSVAAAYGPGGLGVVLTGMGRDGLRGSELLRAAGGCVLAQDRESSVVWGMPGFVTEAGLADAVLPVPQLAAELRRRVPLHPSEAREASVEAGR